MRRAIALASLLFYVTACALPDVKETDKFIVECRKNSELRTFEEMERCGSEAFIAAYLAKDKDGDYLPTLQPYFHQRIEFAKLADKGEITKDELIAHIQHLSETTKQELLAKQKEQTDKVAAVILVGALVGAAAYAAAKNSGGGGSYVPASAPSTPAATDEVFVSGHTKKDGTYVSPHYRSAADGTCLNNWSTKGNLNPHTGRIGTQSCP